MDTTASDAYEDWLALDVPPGFPEIATIDDTRVLVSTWEGRCFVLDMMRRTSTPEPMALALTNHLPTGSCLQTPTVSRDGVKRWCAVATRSGWASLWKLGAKETEAIGTEYGPVNATALNRSGAALAIGVGVYPMNPARGPRAVVELWQTETQRCIATRRLPGVVVDQLAWTSDGAVVVAVTGSQCQHRGHIALLDGETLRILDIAEVGEALCAATAADDYDDRVVAVLRDRITVRRFGDLNEVVQEIPVPMGTHGATIVPDMREVIFPPGLRVGLGKLGRRELPPLPGCVAVGLTGDGQVVGVSQSGIVRLWAGG